MASVPISAALGTPNIGRRQTFVRTTSDATLAVPSWAQGGKGIVIARGVAPGGSGAIGTGSGRGSGGAGGARCFGIPVVIPAGVTTISAVIGATAAAVTAAVATNGVAGGDNTLTVGTFTLRLGGGLGGISGGNAPLGGQVNAPANVTQTSSIFGASTETLMASRGLSGGQGSNSTGGFGAGAPSEFGTGGAGLTAAPVANTNGENATGFGSGGAGAWWGAGGAVSSGAGSPGFWELEFVEGF